MIKYDMNSWMSRQDKYSLITINIFVPCVGFNIYYKRRQKGEH